MATTSTTSRNFPTLRYLAAPFRWLFGSRRRVLTVAAVLLAMIATPPLWWSIQLMGLPDIGDPFDMVEFGSFRIPDERNAFVLYRQAADRLKALDTSLNSKGDQIDRHALWSKAAPIVRRWVEENREAMEIYRRGTDPPDALGLTGPRDRRSYNLLTALFSLKELALLEASRLEEQGDLGGAWTWYRAALRAADHVGLRGTTFERRIAQGWHDEIRRRSGPWAADPRTTPAMLRRALDDAIACEALKPSESYTLKADYQFLENDLTGPHNPGRRRLFAQLRNGFLGSTEYQLDPDLIGAAVDAWRFWRREPERSRRVMRLAIANWLAFHELPADRRPNPDMNVSGPFDFYAFGPEAPAKARALSPEALDRWLMTTSDARELLRAWDLRAVHLRERANHRALVVLLASQLYRRDHGTDPPSDEALVGPYLKELPDDGLGDAGEAKNGGGSAGQE
jgi:hypothetical protein